MAANFNDSPDNILLASVQQADSNVSEEQPSETFWTHESIDASRWNKSFPYQFLLVKRLPDGTYSRDATSKLWTFTLPFPPESMTIAMPFAINGMVTQGGFIEEHNGAPTRVIQLSGTTGVLPLRPHAETRTTANFAGAIFAGTIQQGTRVGNSIRNLASDFTGNNTLFKANLVDDSAWSTVSTSQFQTPGVPFAETNVVYQKDNVATTSGYFQMRLLQNYFENYVAFKKREDGRDYRLAFAMWKDQAIYLVTPISFTVTRNAASPFEYNYSLSLKAWRRIQVDKLQSPPTTVFIPTVRSPNKLARMLKAISDARDVLENARDVLAAVGGDLDRALFEPVRQLSLFCKDALSVPLSFADLPVQVLNDCRDSVVQYMAVKEAFEGASQSFAQAAKRVADAYRAMADAAAASGKLSTRVARFDQALQTANEVHPGYDIFRNPQDNYDIFKDIQVGQLNLSPKNMRSIQLQRLSIRKLGRLDFEQMRDTVKQLAADFADAVGAGNATYNATFQRASRSSSKTPTPSDFKVLFALNRVVMELNRLAASGETTRFKLNTMDYVAGLASRSGIAFKVPKSKYAVPFPYGSTMEQLAQRYLGDPDRWIEIAALNGLRTPYVDEIGFDLPLLVDGRGNQVQVGDSTNLYVGQQVWISSLNSARTMRHITKIERLNSTVSTITVDGDADLERFSTLASAALHAFLPDTVNSMQMVYIPSDKAPADQDYQTKAVPGLTEFDELLAVGGFDLLLTPDGDLAITPDGDCRLAVGLQNIIQTIRIRLAVRQGSLNRHPTFGLPIQTGVSTADVDVKSLYKAVKNLFNDDPAFTGVDSVAIKKAGPGVTIGMNIGIRGLPQVVPVTLDFKP